MLRVFCDSLFAAMCALLAALAPIAGAQSYPTKPIHLVAPFPLGDVDINARILADPLRKELDQTIVVNNRPGAFGVTTAKRAKTLPEVPTIAEAGVPGYEYGTWYGLVAPAGVPRTVISKLNKAAVTVLKTPEVQRLYESQGLDPIPSTSAHYATHLKSETEKWTKVVRAAKISVG